MKSVFAFATIALTLLGSYAGTYLLTVREITQGSMRYPDYIVGGDLAAAFFQPAHRIDRWLRPDYWGKL
jgi:hypothetical protein